MSNWENRCNELATMNKDQAMMISSLSKKMLKHNTLVETTRILLKLSEQYSQNFDSKTKIVIKMTGDAIKEIDDDYDY